MAGVDMQKAEMFNIRGFGAKGNGESLDTAAVQAARGSRQYGHK